MKIVKALLSTISLFAIALALTALPVYFGEIGLGILFGTIFLIVFISIFYTMEDGD